MSKPIGGSWYARGLLFAFVVSATLPAFATQIRCTTDAGSVVLRFEESQKSLYVVTPIGDTDSCSGVTINSEFVSGVCNLPWGRAITGMNRSTGAFGVRYYAVDVKPRLSGRVDNGSCAPMDEPAHKF